MQPILALCQFDRLPPLRRRWFPLTEEVPARAFPGTLLSEGNRCIGGIVGHGNKCIVSALSRSRSEKIVHHLSPPVVPALRTCSVRQLCTAASRAIGSVYRFELVRSQSSTLPCPSQFFPWYGTHCLVSSWAALRFVGALLVAFESHWPQVKRRRGILATHPASYT